MPGAHIRRWPDARRTTLTEHPGWRSWRHDDNQNRAYPSRQTVQLEGSTSMRSEHFCSESSVPHITRVLQLLLPSMRSEHFARNDAFKVMQTAPTYKLQ